MIICKRKKQKAIGILWLVIGLLYIIAGISNLYEYSTPGLLWMFIVPEMTAYTQIISGVLCLSIGLSFINGKLEKTYLILPLFLLQIIYFLIDVFEFAPSIIEVLKYGIFTILESYDKLIILILIAISLRILKLQTKDLTEKLTENKTNVLISVIVISLPYFLSKIAPYKFYEFLH